LSQSVEWTSDLLAYIRGELFSGMGS